VQPKVFIVVINWNGENDTIPCLYSLLRLEYNNAHVVISDNGSREESLDCIRSWRSEHSASFGQGGIASLEILENRCNLGFTGGNTVGIKHALNNGADYVLFLNNDTLVTPDFLTKMVKAGDADPAVGIIGCKIYMGTPHQPGTPQIWSLGGYSFVRGLPLNVGGGQYDKPQWNGIKVQPMINGCCMLIKKRVIETVGVQDDRLFFGMDDVEYSLRAHRYGWKNVVVYDAAIYHAGSQSVTPRSGLQVYYNFRNALQFRSRAFPWYRNLIFYLAFTVRYLVGGSLARWITGRGKANRGVYYALVDFLRGRTGECGHVAQIKRT
jgi:GT2 family glycosyltransferase